MAGQGKTLLILGGVLAAGIAAALWFAMSGGSVDEPGPAQTSSASADAAAKSAAPTAPRAKRVGTAAVFGEIRRSLGKAPVADQEVTLAPERGDPWTTTTDARGAFQFDKIPHGGPYELSAAAKGCGTIRLTGIALDRNEQRNVGTLWLDPSVKLTVRVRSGADQPLAGAVVEAFAIPVLVDWDWSKALAQIGQAPIAVTRATTDAKGEALFPEMAVGQWTFTATKGGFAPGGTSGVSLRSAEAPTPVTIYLTAGHALDGHVLGPDKKPVAGAFVMAGASGSAWDIGSAPLRTRTTSDADGKYAFAALESGEAQLWVARAGGVPAPAAAVRVPLVPHYDIVLKDTGVLAGVVTERESGKPVEGATVRATSWESGGANVGESTTDAEGKYSLAMAAGPVNQLNAEKDGLLQVRDAPRGGMRRPAVLHEGETVVRNIVLRHAAKLTGVVKGGGAPLAGVHVSLASGSQSEGFNQRSATSDADGRYEFAAVEKGSVLLLATKEGWFLPDAPDDMWRAAQSPDAAKNLKVDVPETGDVQKDLEMKRGSVVSGVVLGPTGAPLAGVRVGAPGAAESSPTAADGKFQLDGVTPGAAVQLSCAKEGFTLFGAKPVAVVADQPTTDLTLRMVNEARVHGAVTAASGAPLTDARVFLAAKNGDQEDPWDEQWRWQSAVRVPVKPDGTFDAPMPFAAPAQLLVRAVSLNQQQVDAKPVPLVDGQESYEVNLVLPDGTDLVGKVVAKAGGAAVAGADVSLAPHADDDNGIYMSGDMEHPVWAVTDAAGAFRVPHLAPGKYDLRAQAAGFIVEGITGEVGDGKTVTIELPQEMSIDGVVAFADGAPVEGVEVQASGAAQPGRVFGGIGMPEQVSAVTDARGAFHIAGVAAGDYSLDVGSSWREGVNIRSKHLDGIAAGAKDLKITVEAGASISGRVVDSKGRPVAWARISASPTPGPGAATSGGLRSVPVNEDGTFALVGLEDCPYLLRVRTNAGSSNFQPTQVDSVAAGTKDLTIVLQEGLAISGVVVDPDGKPLSQVGLRAMPVDAQEKRSTRSAWTDDSGKFNLGGLAPGTYRLDTMSWGGPGSGWVLDAAQTYAAGATDLRLVATKGATITGVVVDETGNPVGGAAISASVKNGASPSAQSKDDGTFTVVGLQKDAVCTLNAQAKGRVSAEVADVAAGAADVRIVLAKGLEASGRLVDAAGKPMANATINFSGAGARRGLSTQTDAAGRFTVDGLAAGTYEATVTLRTPGHVFELKNVGSIKAGDREVELHMPQ